MITPIIIQIVFWLGVLGCVAVGGRIMLASFDTPDYSRDFERYTAESDKKAKSAPARHFSVATFASGLAIVLLGPLGIRILCELDIILFKIHDELKASNDRHRYQP